MAVPLKSKEMEEIRAFFWWESFYYSEFDRHPSSVLKKDIKEEILKISLEEDLFL